MLPPTKLQNVPGLQEFPFVFPQPCVYFLCLGSEIVYIGSSQNLFSRLPIHFFGGFALQDKKNFDSVFFIEIDADRFDLQEVESAFIRRFKPRLNFGQPTKRGPRLVVSKYKSAHKDAAILKHFGVEPANDEEPEAIGFA
jgi:hypothetical protein